MKTGVESLFDCSKTRYCIIINIYWKATGRKNEVE